MIWGLWARLLAFAEDPLANLANDGRPNVDAGRRAVRAVSIATALTVGGINIAGALSVTAFAWWVLPGDPFVDSPRALRVNLICALIWAPLGIAVGAITGHNMMKPARRWLLEGREPSEWEATRLLKGPLLLLRVQLTVWMLSAGVFMIANAFLSIRLVVRVGLTMALGGLMTSTLAYLMAEWITRPLVARALASVNFTAPRLPGVISRQLLTWGLGTGAPLIGLVLAGIFGLIDKSSTEFSLALTMITLGCVGLTVGSLTMLLGLRAVAQPVRSVRRGLVRVAEGDLDVRITVSDGSELGLLQEGFNQMVDAMRERDRIREVFERHVGEDVVTEALHHETGLGGEEHTVAVLFVDMVGSTKFAAHASPSEVVELLNRYFAIVVEVVESHNGWINKFQGDAALAVFGTPTELVDYAGAALAAGRELAERMRSEMPECRVGVGITAGRVVAGNIGAEHRFEYTVIGDPVNEAARLTELAKTTDEGVIASGDAITAALSSSEVAGWVIGDVVALRGRTSPTVVHLPVAVGSEPSR